MPVQTFKTKDEVPAEHAEKAIEGKDGTFHVFTDEDTGALKSALEKERKAAKDAKRLAAEQAERLAQIEADGKEAELAKAGLRDVKKKWQQEELDPVVKEREAFKQKFLDRALAGEIKDILADLDVIDVDAAYRLLGADFELGDEEKPVLKADPTADVRKHLEKVLGERYKYLVKGSQADGGGAKGAKGAGAGSGTTKSPTQMTTAEIAEFVAKHGQPAYMKLLEDEQRALLMPRKKEQKAA